MTASRSTSDSGRRLARLVARIGRCRLCVEAPAGAPLPHAPRPVLRVSRTARLLVAGQAPGLRVHGSGLPFDDPSGDRLRRWMGIDRDTFYDAARVAFAPMGFCFPGYDAQGYDLPPRRECAAHWRQAVMAALPQVETILCVGRHAQVWHLKAAGLDALARGPMRAALANWRAVLAATAPRLFLLPHPSWRNSAWLKRNPWFEEEVAPALAAEVARLVTPG